MDDKKKDIALLILEANTFEKRTVLTLQKMTEALNSLNLVIKDIYVQINYLHKAVETLNTSKESKDT